MNKNEYLEILGKHLGHLSKEEKEDVLGEYEQHFCYAMQRGKSEDIIASELGNPKELAKQFIACSRINKAESSLSAADIFRAVVAVTGLGLLNTIFVLPVFIALAAVMLSLFAAATGSVIFGVALISVRLLMLFIPSLDLIGMDIITTILLSIALVSFGILFFKFVIFLAKYFCKEILKYLKQNIRIVKNERRNESA